MQAPLLWQRPVTRCVMISTLFLRRRFLFCIRGRFALLRCFDPPMLLLLFLFFLLPNGRVKMIEGGETCIYNNGHNFLVLEALLLKLKVSMLKAPIRSDLCQDNLGRVAYLLPLFSMINVRNSLPPFLSSRGKEKNYVL